MFKNRKDKAHLLENSRFGNISKKSNIVLNIILSLFALLSLIPFAFVVIISFTSESALKANGYSFFPKEFSIAAYKYVLNSSNQMLKSYGVTILITVIGTLLGLLLISTYAFAISRKSFAYRRFFTLMAFIPMLFSGGLVPFYLIMTRLLNLKNSIWALILPVCMNSFYIMVLRTFFKTSVPDAVIESAKIDGASELRLFFQIVLPISLPGMATIGLFLTLGYWNDWFNAMLFIDTNALTPLQYLLIRIENSMEFLSQNAAKLGLTQVEVAAGLPKETAKMAMVVLATAPIIFAYPFFQKYFVNGLTIGAVKE
ncbi:ABC transporter permease subunit [Desnuesiella massiliensis]|uniref:ABC transporter permease subunit n=1 Tax=Desnuesiella massiliensis TaxID=1650662 RepID=UPI0006E1AA7C